MLVYKTKNRAKFPKDFFAIVQYTGNMAAMSSGESQVFDDDVSYPFVLRLIDHR